MNTRSIKRGTLPVILIIMMAAAVRTASAQSGDEREFHQTYTVSAKGTVSLTNASGTVRITSWAENRVKVDAVKTGRRGSDFSQVRIEVTAEADRIDIRTVYPRGRNVSVSVDYELTVPQTVDLASIKTASGDISITGPVSRASANTASGEITAVKITGDATLTTASGRVTASGVGGELRIQTASGDIQVDGAESRLFAQAASGSIRCRNVGGDASLGTAGGSISIEQTGGRVSARAVSGSISVKDAGGDVQADSLSDSVTVTGAKGLVNASTLSGNIILTGIQEGIRAKAVSGRIQITSSGGRIDARTTSDSIIMTDLSSSDINARTTSGEVRFSGNLTPGGNYSLESFSGNVTLILPSGTGFNLSARTRPDRLQSDFDLKSDPVAQSRGSLSAVAGDGGAVINVATFSGTIYLKKK